MAKWTCSEPGCEKDWGILVVTGPDGMLTTRCQTHIGDLKATPGQWIDNDGPEAA